VPAAAVIRGGQVLFGVIGRKEFVDCFTYKKCKVIKKI